MEVDNSRFSPFVPDPVDVDLSKSGGSGSDIHVGRGEDPFAGRGTVSSDSSDPYAGRGDRTGDDDTLVRGNTGGDSPRNPFLDDVGAGYTGLSSWIPDSSKSPQENLDSLLSWLTNLFSASHFTDNISSGVSYTNTLVSAWNAVWRLGEAAGLESEARLTLAEKVADLSWSFITSEFTNALQYQSWYLQQEYNSPVQQVNRLAEAGLSSVFALGAYNSGNAQQPAGVSPTEIPSPSNVGEVQNQSKGRELEFIGSLVSAAASFLPSAAGAVGTLVTSFATKKLSAKQIQLADSEIKNNAATFEKLQAEGDQIRNNIGLQMFDSIYKSSEQIVSQSQSRVTEAYKRMKNAQDMYMSEVELQGYRVKVKTKGGSSETRDITSDEFKNALDNNFTLSDGSTILLETNSRGKLYGELSAEGSFSASTGIPGIAGGSAGGSMGAKFGAELEVSKGSTRGSSSSRSDSHSVSSSEGKSHQGYSSKGTSFTIGDTTFESVTIRRKMPLPEFKKVIDKSTAAYQKALDEYNTLSTGEKARLCDLLHHLERNLSSFNAGLIHSQYMSKINSLFTPKPIIGD